MKCPTCHQDNPDRAKFCVECGHAMPAACASCGAPVPSGAKFCPECGHATGAAAERPRFASPDAYTPKHLAERILTSRAALEGERKHVTVLFADMKGSMELLADRDPEDARRILDPVLERMMEAVHRYEGTVNQVMGDGIMALFGAPLAHEDHAVRACYAALRMQDAVHRYTEEVRRAHGLEVAIRVGLNSGEVVVRSVGSDLRMDYTAVGQTTHLAARMEQLAAPGSIRLTADTLRIAEGYVKVQPLGPVPVKGLSAPVEVYELTGTGVARTRLQAAAARGLTRFVGRDTEMEQLRDAADVARRGRGQITAVVGEPGVGKSRLYYEFVHSHHAHGWLVLEAGSVSYGKATPFLPLIDLLKGYFRIEARDDVRTIRAKVTGIVLTLDEALRDSIAPVLWLLDALADDDRLLAMEPGVRRQRTLDAVRRLLLRESVVQPLMLVFEDLHWVDAETQAFLDTLVESLPAAAILLAVNYRPEYRHAWGGKTYYRQLVIDSLRADSAEALLESLIGADPSVAALRTLLIQRTDGNPLYLEESVRELVESGVLSGARGRYRLAEPLESVRVPATVRAIIAARIDRLSPDDKRLLQAASVVGKDVPLALLEALGEVTGDALRQGLARLGAAELIYEARLFPEIEYTFKHALTHEVAYGAVLNDRRRELHAGVVHAMERVYADRLGEHVEVLAHHALRGGVLEKAARFLRLAGVKAAARSANDEAIGFFEQALEVLAALPVNVATQTEELEVRIVLGPALIATKGSMGPVVEASYARARELVDALGRDTARFPVLWGSWFVNYQRGRYGVAHDTAEQLLVAAEAGDDTGHLVEAHHGLWATLSAMGRPLAALPHIERGIELYDRERHGAQAFLYGGHDAGTCCRYHLATTRWQLGAPDRALPALDDALRSAEELGHPMSTAITFWFAIWVHYQRGDRDAMVRSAQRVLELATAHRFMGWIDVAPVILDAVNRPGAAKPFELRDWLAASRTRGASWRHAFTACVIAEVALAAEHLDVAEEALASVAVDQRETFYGSEIERLGGELALRRPRADASDAEARFRRAVALAQRQSATSLELRAATSLARLLSSGGRHDEARRVLADRYASFTEGFDTADLVAARVLLSELGP